MAKFEVGDLVKINEDKIGFVGWNKNKCMNLKEEDGYLGIDLLTDTMGFTAPVKEDECTKSSIKEVINWWREKSEETEKRLRQAYIAKSEFDKLQGENKTLKELLRIYL
ncbi:hypothetical protein [Clostridium kluyveri]|uniref:Uncharacterized protein n=1 Tax=Clostridium kluyveri TaxID=1534 RepID=A0A1L5F8W3_CLOKL|nr:hypothetical protein [Clostridium kluyveri]APM39429.1 hypothetical protein BS101_12085 [Clostridium kluyveri]